MEVFNIEPVLRPSPDKSATRFAAKRPTFLDLSSTFNANFDKSSPESGYSSTFTSPDTEVAPVLENDPFDFSQLWKQLQPLAKAQEVVELKPIEALAFVPALPALPEPPAIIIQQQPSITVPIGVQYVGQPCIFWINSESNTEINCFAEGPNGFNYKVDTCYIHSLGQHKCGFLPVKAGIHTVHVSLKQCKKWEDCFGYADDEGFAEIEKNLDGSHFMVNICRNYSLESFRRPILNIDMEMFDQGLVVRRKPWGIATNVKQEQIMVTDREQHQVIIYSPDGTIITTFGEFGDRTGQFRRPTGIAFDPVNDRIYVTDKDNHRVQVFTALGIFIFAFGYRGRSNGAFSFPWGVAISKSGDLIAIADSRNHRLQLFNKNGQFLRKYSDGGKYFDYPRGVEFDPTDSFIYVTDFNLHHVVKVDINFTKCTMIVDETQLKRPQGLLFDENGQLLVVSSRQHTIKVFNPNNGQLLHEITNVNSSDLDLPLNVISLYSGFIAVLDMNGRISVF